MLNEELLPVSVVVIARNAEDHIRNCLNQITKNRPAEIVVIDGNSSDKTAEISRLYTKRVFSDQGLGKAYARQLGAEKSTQKYVAYVDADVLLDNLTLKTMLDELNNSKYISISAKVSCIHESYNYWQWAQWKQSQYNNRRISENHLATWACIIPKDIVLKYKFDLDGGGIDDLDLEYKLKKAGYKLGMGSGTFRHCWIQNIHQFYKYRLYHGRLKPHFIKKYGPWHLGYYPPLVTGFWLIFCVSRFDFKLIPMIIIDGVAEMAGLMFGIIDILAKKKLIHIRDR
jgi:glycosyltransferase involved in cell wall biosynthesis